MFDRYQELIVPLVTRYLIGCHDEVVKFKFLDDFGNEPNSTRLMVEVVVSSEVMVVFRKSAKSSSGGVGL